MKTIALKEKTFELINELKKKKGISSFDKLMIYLVRKEDRVQASMFGALKGKAKPFTRKERQSLWRDSNRDF